MKAEYLRIGNWVHHNDMPSASEYEGDFKWALEHFYDLSTSDLFISSIEGIPLTEEWLLSFGFDYVKQIAGYADKWHFVCANESVFTIHPFCTNDVSCHIEIKYVHELQNLCFALTGTELNLTTLEKPTT